MPEGRENRTEPATARRRQEARDSGQFAKSNDFTAAVLLLAGILAIHYTGQGFVENLGQMLRSLLSSPPNNDAGGLLQESIRQAGPHVVRVLLPIMLTMAVVAYAINAFQIGFRFTTAPLVPSLAKLNPIGGLGRLFSGQNWFQMAMNLIKLGIVGTFAITQFRQNLPLIVALSSYDFPLNMAMGFDLIFGLALRIAIVLVILGLLDWFYHRWKFERDIRMTKQEIKDEARRMDGDPEIKGRRRQLARKMIMQRIASDVPRADVIVTNPTELAIALKYDPATMAAPRVLAKGAGYLAMQIRQVAVQNGVPIVERKPLAQALYKTVEVGQEVPPQFYQAIAEILAYVFELAGKGYRKAKERELVGT